MSERKSKFFGLVFFLLLVFAFTYLMITGSGANGNAEYNQVEISGAELLPAEEYLRYSGLNDLTKYPGLTLLEVKTKIEKHPYMRKAEVESDGISKILVEVHEKVIKAVLLQKNELKLITSELETLPLFPPSAIQNLPVISSLSVNEKNPFNEKDISFAFRIIDAVSLSDTNVRKNLAEINLRKGGDVILIFTGLKFPVLFGKNDEIRKALILKNLWQQLISSENNYGEIEYLDLRYGNKVFIGKRKKESVSG
jgi:cell division septal protein FtsQ